MGHLDQPADRPAMGHDVALLGWFEEAASSGPTVSPGWGGIDMVDDQQIASVIGMNSGGWR